MPVKDQEPNFKKIQYAITSMIRDPNKLNESVSIDSDKLSVYQELLFNNMEDYIKSSFPVIHKILTEEHWLELIRDYFSHHQAKTPLFHEIPQEFLHFLQEERKNEADPPFLLELAHYEWVELAIDIAMDKIDAPQFNTSDDLLKTQLMISPLVWILKYHYPVHLISPEYMPTEKNDEMTYLIVYRNRREKVQFMEVNAVSARLLEIIQQNKHCTGHEVLIQIANELNHSNPNKIIEFGYKILDEFARLDIILKTI